MPITGNTILHTDFNESQVIFGDIMGIGENGYGLALIQSAPVELKQRISAQQWNELTGDANAVYQHITNGFTTSQYVSTGTTIIGAALPTELLGIATWSNDPIRRYTCHPNQFIVNAATSNSVFFGDSTSTRTLPWGVSASEITHKVVASFPTRLSARYYFNIGSYLTYVPFYSGAGLNDLDAEWADFIDYLVDPVNTYTYRRSDFVDWVSTGTEWTSGTLSVSVLAEKAVDEKSVQFTIKYRNNDASTLIVSPAVAFWNILI